MGFYIKKENLLIGKGDSNKNQTIKQQRVG